MQSAPGQKALDWRDENNPTGWKKLTAGQVQRLKGAENFKELDLLVQDRTVKLHKFLQEVGTQWKLFSYMLGTELDESLTGAHFHL